MEAASLLACLLACLLGCSVGRGCITGLITVLQSYCNSNNEYCFLLLARGNIDCDCDCVTKEIDTCVPVFIQLGEVKQNSKVVIYISPPAVVRHHNMKCFNSNVTVHCKLLLESIFRLYRDGYYFLF